MAESVKKRSEIEKAYTWKLEDMIESPEKFEELMDGVEERIPEYETYRGKLGSSAEYLKNYLTYDESVDETLSLLSAYAMQKRDQDTSVSENQARPIHTGCLFEVADDGITVIAVDGYRLALRRWTPVPLPGTPPFTAGTPSRWRARGSTAPTTSVTAARP